MNDSTTSKNWYKWYMICIHRNMYKGIIILVSKYAFMIFHIIFVIVKLVHDKEKLKVYSYSCSPRLSINLKIIC